MLISVLIPVLLLAGITKSIEDIMSRIEIDKLVSRRLIAVNLGPVKQTSALQLSAAIAKAICRIFASEAENGVSVVYVPHDYKDDVKSGEAFVEVLRLAACDADCVCCVAPCHVHHCCPLVVSESFSVLLLYSMFFVSRCLLNDSLFCK